MAFDDLYSFLSILSESVFFGFFYFYFSGRTRKKATTNCLIIKQSEGKGQKIFAKIVKIASKFSGRARIIAKKFWSMARAAESATVPMLLYYQSQKIVRRGESGNNVALVRHLYDDRTASKSKKEFVLLLIGSIVDSKFD